MSDDRVREPDSGHADPIDREAAQIDAPDDAPEEIEELIDHARELGRDAARRGKSAGLGPGQPWCHHRQSGAGRAQRTRLAARLARECLGGPQPVTGQLSSVRRSAGSMSGDGSVTYTSQSSVPGCNPCAAIQSANRCHDEPS